MWRRLGLAFVFAAGCRPADAWAQQLGGGQAPDISLVRIGAALAVCVLAAIALALTLRRRAGRAPLNLTGWRRGLARGRRIEVVEARRLSPTADVSILRCEGTEYLLLSGPGGHAVLREWQAESAAVAGDDAR
jgi:hypothetical protein